MISSSTILPSFGNQAVRPVCRVCYERPAAKAYLNQRGNYRCSRCYLHEAVARRQAKWDKGYRPTCKNHPDVQVSQSVYVNKGKLRCSPCIYDQERRTVAEKRAATRSYIREYKMTHPCADCGEADWRCLDFDHQGGKEFDLADHAGHTIVRVKAEMAKCVVRCANCHRKRHTGT